MSAEASLAPAPTSLQPNSFFEISNFRFEISLGMLGLVLKLKTKLNILATHFGFETPDSEFQIRAAFGSKPPAQGRAATGLANCFCYRRILRGSKQAGQSCGMGPLASNP